MSEVSEIYKVLTKKKYNRNSPFLPAEIKKIITRCVKSKVPIPLIGFWGIGFKSQINWADEATCDFFNKLNQEVSKAYSQGILFTFILAIPHGLHNGVSKETIENYLTGVKSLFEKNGFNWIILDDLWRGHGISFEEIDKELKRKPKDWWTKMDNAAILEKRAAERNQRLSPKLAAQKYVVMRELEKPMLETQFKGQIFHAFADSGFKNVLPHMPILFLYSYKKGRSASPWFIY